MRWLWVGILGPVAVVVGVCWALGFVMDRQELAQRAGVAALAAIVWVALHPRRGPAGVGGDAIDMKHIRAERAVKAKTGLTTLRGGDRIRMRRIRAGGDAIGKQTHPSVEPPR